MNLFGLHLVDLAVILGSLAAILWIGVSVSRGVKGETEFFVGGRKLGPVLQFFLNFGQMTDSNGAPMVASEVYRQGAAGLWIPFQPLFSTPFYWFSSIWWRRSRLITGPDQFVERFNSRKLAIAFAAWGLMLALLGGTMGNIVSYKVAAAMLAKPESAYTEQDRAKIAEYREYRALAASYATGSLSEADQTRFRTLDGLSKKGLLMSSISFIEPLPFYMVYSGVIAIYILLGGIKAAAYTDVFQGLLIIVFSFLLIPIGLSQLGGFAGLHARLPEHMFLVFGSPSVSDYAWYTIGAFVLMGVIAIAGPAGCGTAVDERSLRIGVLGGAFAKRIVMLAWMLCGLIAVGLLHGEVADPDNTWGAMSRHLLGPGLLGLMISGILLGHMPAVGAGAVNFSATFTRNLYEPLFPGRSGEHYMMIAKASIVVVLGAGIVGAMLFSGILSLFTLMVSLGAFMGTLGFLMLFWRGLTTRAVVWGWIGWMVFLIVIPWGLPRIEKFRESTGLTLQTDARTVDVRVPATVDDVSSGRAAKTGEVIVKARVIPPMSIFFESVTPVRPGDKTSPMEGNGRFHVENYLLHQLGVPLQRWGTAELNACRWAVDAIGPFFVLVGLSYALPHRRVRLTSRLVSGRVHAATPALVTVGSITAEREELELASANATAGRAIRYEADLTRPRDRSAEDSGIPSPESYADAVMNGNLIAFCEPDESPEREEIRLARFFAKLKTPIAPSPKEDERELALSFADPERYDHLKLFPRSKWEFTRWSKADVQGFAGCWAGVIAVLVLFWLILRIGA